MPWIRRRGGLGRPPKPRFLDRLPTAASFIPYTENGVPLQGEPIYLSIDELEALRLVYLEGMTQEEAANRMKISRGTLWRLLQSGRKKVVRGLIERRPLVLSPAESGLT